MPTLVVKPVETMQQRPVLRRVGGFRISVNCTYNPFVVEAPQSWQSESRLMRDLADYLMK